MKCKKLNIVLAVGVFDLFHRGHVEFLKKAKSLGDKLIVVVNGDIFTEKYKRKPVYSEEDRAEIIKSNVYVDEVYVSNSADVKPFLEMCNISIIVHGDDWPREKYLNQICLSEDYLQKNSIKLVYTEYYKKINTTHIIKNIKN